MPPMQLVIDIFFLIAIIAIAFMGFNFGIIKVATVILGMYIGMQIAALFYPIFGGLTANQSSASSIYTNQIVWFFILWVVWSIIFSLVGFSFTNSIVLPKRLGNVDQLGGLALGLFAGIFGLLIVGFVLKNTMVLFWYGSGRPGNWLGSLVTGFDNSIIFGVFRTLKVVYLNILSPWLPANKIPVFFETTEFN